MKKYFFLLLTLFCFVYFVPDSYAQKKSKESAAAELRYLKREYDSLNRQIVALKSRKKSLEYQCALNSMNNKSSEKETELMNKTSAAIMELEKQRDETGELIKETTRDYVQRGVVKEMQDRGLYDSNFNRPSIDNVTSLIYSGHATVNDYAFVIDVYRLNPRSFTDLPETEQINIMSAYNDKLKETKGGIEKIKDEQKKIVLNLCDIWEQETGFRPNLQKTETIIQDYYDQRTDNIKALMFKINEQNPDNSFTPNHPQYQSLEKFVDASEKYYQHQKEEAVKSENEVNTLEKAFNDLVHMCPKCAQELNSKKVIDN